MANFKMRMAHCDAVVEYMWLKFGCKPKDMPEQFLSQKDRLIEFSNEFRHVAWLSDQSENACLDFDEPLDWLLGEHGYALYSIRLARRLNSD